MSRTDTFEDDLRRDLHDAAGVSSIALGDTVERLVERGQARQLRRRVAWSAVAVAAAVTIALGAPRLIGDPAIDPAPGGSPSVGVTSSSITDSPGVPSSSTSESPVTSNTTYLSLSLKAADPTMTAPIELRAAPSTVGPDLHVRFERKSGGPIGFVTGAELQLAADSPGTFQQGDGAGFDLVYGLTASKPTNVKVTWGTEPVSAHVTSVLTRQIPGQDAWLVVVNLAPIDDGASGLVTKVTWVDGSGVRQAFTRPAP